jgi:hypothetical protein
MTSLMRRALESELIHPEQAPEDDDMMVLFQTHFPEHFGGASSYSLEERSDGKAGDEFEHTLYAKLTDPSQLSQAKSMEHQSQWEIRIEKTEKNAGKGSVRVRKTWIDGGDPDFVRTTKIPLDPDGGNAKKKEIPMPSNADEFLAFQFLADQGMVKDRYHFPIMGTDLVWEVDCYPKEGGGYHEWVKIDLEVKDLSAPLPELPIQLEDVILPVGVGKLTKQEHDERVSQLYDDCFISPNPFKSGQIRKQVEQAGDEADLGDGAADAANKPQEREAQPPQENQADTEGQEGGTKDQETVEDTSTESGGEGSDAAGASGEPSGGGI